MLSDSAFTFTPVHSQSPTTMRLQSHAAIQRSPSSVQEQVSALSRKLSVKSNESHSSHDPHGILSTIHQGEEVGKGSGDSTSSLIEGTNNCSLAKSSSARSYTSLRGIGTHQVGTLRVHSPSPTRSPTEKMHPCLEDGDIFIVRDIPAGVIFGYDTRTFSIKEPGQFEGIKNMPPGPHLIWAGSDVASLRTGYWIMTSKKTSDQYGEAYVRQWDKYNEVLDE
jgi:A1 cistron-splicing factor AAR2